MNARILDGKSLAADLRAEVAAAVAAMKGIAPAAARIQAMRRTMASSSGMPGC